MQTKHIYFILFLVALLCFKNSDAQNKLFLCTGYGKDGSYSGAYERWNIQKDGNYMYIYFQPLSILRDTVYVSIDKTYNRRDSNYYQYDRYFLVPDSSKKWAVNKYTFTKPGKYKITAFDINNNQLSEPYYTDIDINLNDYKDMHYVDTWYYNQSKIGFYEKAVGDSMIGRNDVFPYKPEGTNVVLYIEQPEKQPFKTNHFLASIYTNDNNHRFITSKMYYVNEQWHWTFVNVDFDKKGKYLLELYNEDDVFINSSPIEIK